MRGRRWTVPLTPVGPTALERALAAQLRLRDEAELAHMVRELGDAQLAEIGSLAFARENPEPTAEQIVAKRGRTKLQARRVVHRDPKPAKVAQGTDPTEEAVYKAVVGADGAIRPKAIHATTNAGAR